MKKKMMSVPTWLPLGSWSTVPLLASLKGVQKRRPEQVVLATGPPSHLQVQDDAREEGGGEGDGEPHLAQAGRLGRDEGPPGLPHVGGAATAAQVPDPVPDLLGQQPIAKLKTGGQVAR